MFRPGNLGHLGRLGLVAASRNAFSPLSLFSASEPGAWYDTSDMSTLFQDSEGTTPVTAVEQPVGLILDKSGRGNHATQATTTKRPVLNYDASAGRYYLRFDGVDDALQTGNIDFTGTDKMTVWAGAVFSPSENQMLVNHNATGFRSFRILTISETSIASAAAGLSNACQALSPYPEHTITAQYDLSLGAASVRVDGADAGSGVSPVGVSTFDSAPLYVGSQEGVTRFFNGRLYSLIVRGAQSSLSQIEATEAYIKQKMRLP